MNENDFESITIIYPEYEALKEEVAKKRTELSMLFLERDNLIYQENKNIEMEYLLAVGDLEYKVFELDNEVRRKKREVELIQAQVNRHQTILIEQINEQLDREFELFQELLDDQLDKMNSAIERSHGTLLSKEETKEMKKLYRIIIKELHPDLHPDLSEAQKRLFLNAVNSYEKGDLNDLRIIATMVGKSDFPEPTDDAMSELEKEEQRLTDLLKSVKDEIGKIKSEFPYTMKEFVNDPEKIKKKQDELQQQLDQLTEFNLMYDHKINEMLGN